MSNKIGVIGALSVMLLFFIFNIHAIIVDGWETTKLDVYITLCLWAFIWAVWIIGDWIYKKNNR